MKHLKNSRILEFHNFEFANFEIKNNSILNSTIERFSKLNTQKFVILKVKHLRKTLTTKYSK